MSPERQKPNVQEFELLAMRLRDEIAPRLKRRMTSRFRLVGDGHSNITIFADRTSSLLVEGKPVKVPVEGKLVKRSRKPSALRIQYNMFRSSQFLAESEATLNAELVARLQNALDSLSKKKPA